MASYSFVSALVDLLVISLEILVCETERRINNVTYETSAKTNKLQWEKKDESFLKDEKQ